MCLKGPELVIAEAGLDFGLVQIGNSSKSFIRKISQEIKVIFYLFYLFSLFS